MPGQTQPCFAQRSSLPDGTWGSSCFLRGLSSVAPGTAAPCHLLRGIIQALLNWPALRQHPARHALTWRPAGSWEDERATRAARAAPQGGVYSAQNAQHHDTCARSTRRSTFLLTFCVCNPCYYSIEGQFFERQLHKHLSFARGDRTSTNVLMHVIHKDSSNYAWTIGLQGLPAACCCAGKSSELPDPHQRAPAAEPRRRRCAAAARCGRAPTAPRWAPAQGRASAPVAARAPQPRSPARPARLPQSHHMSARRMTYTCHAQSGGDEPGTASSCL